MYIYINREYESHKNFVLFINKDFEQILFAINKIRKNDLIYVGRKKKYYPELRKDRS